MWEDILNALGTAISTQLVMSADWGGGSTKKRPPPTAVAPQPQRRMAPPPPPPPLPLQQDIRWYNGDQVEHVVKKTCDANGIEALASCAVTRNPGDTMLQETLLDHLLLRHHVGNSDKRPFFIPLNYGAVNGDYRNYNGNHWTGLHVIPNPTEPTKPTVIHMDLYGGELKGWQKAKVEHAVRSMYPKANIISNRVQLQGNGYDCGPNVDGCAYVAKDFRLETTQDELDQRLATLGGVIDGNAALMQRVRAAHQQAGSFPAFQAAPSQDVSGDAALARVWQDREIEDERRRRQQEALDERLAKYLASDQQIPALSAQLEKAEDLRHARETDAQVEGAIRGSTAAECLLYRYLLAKQNKEREPEKAYSGIGLVVDITPQGLQVKEVMEGSAAAGRIQPGTLITHHHDGNDWIDIRGQKDAHIFLRDIGLANGELRLASVVGASGQMVCFDAIPCHAFDAKNKCRYSFAGKMVVKEQVQEKAASLFGTGELAEAAGLVAQAYQRSSQSEDKYEGLAPDAKEKLIAMRKTLKAVIRAGGDDTPSAVERLYAEKLQEVKARPSGRD